MKNRSIQILLFAIQFFFLACYTQIRDPSVTDYDDEPVTYEPETETSDADSNFIHPQIENNYYFYNEPFYPRYGGWVRSRFYFPPSAFRIGFGYYDPWDWDPYGYGPDWYWDPLWGWTYYSYWGSGYSYYCSPYYSGYPYYTPVYTYSQPRKPAPFGRRYERTPDGSPRRSQSVVYSSPNTQSSRENVSGDRRVRRGETVKSSSSSKSSRSGSRSSTTPKRGDRRSSKVSSSPGNGGNPGNPPSASGNQTGNSGRRTRK